jgi:hypothetical protein
MTFRFAYSTRQTPIARSSQPGRCAVARLTAATVFADDEQDVRTPIGRISQRGGHATLDLEGTVS